MLMLFAVMLTIKAAFTLTGFAGLALTVGMAVDNNVLVFERLREELDRGATLRMAIRNAFHRAGTTIIDCNLTHLIAATVLYMVGSDQIKGFAVTLWLGVVTSMYTSVFVARVIFDIAEKRQWITKVKMMRVIGHTNIDFMGWFPYCLTASILITVMAIVVSFDPRQGPVRHRLHRRRVGAGGVRPNRRIRRKVRELLSRPPARPGHQRRASGRKRAPGAAVQHQHVGTRHEGGHEDVVGGVWRQAGPKLP